jgi:hypothetical protein
MPIAEAIREQTAAPPTTPPTSPELGGPPAPAVRPAEPAAPAARGLSPVDVLSLGLLGVSSTDVEDAARKIADLRRTFLEGYLRQYNLTPEQVSKSLADYRRQIEGLRQEAAKLGVLAAEPGAEPPIEAERQQAFETARKRLWSTAALVMSVPDVERLKRDLEARPFLSGDERNALGRVLQGLGLIATLAGGLARGAPRAALAAYTGALQGWREGDRERAERAWRLFQANLLVARNRLDQARVAWETAREEAGLNVREAEARVTSKWAQMGLLKELTALQGRSVSDQLAVLTMLQNMVNETLRDAVQLTVAKELQQTNALMRLALALPPWRFREQELELKKRELQLKELEHARRPLEEARKHFYDRLGHQHTGKLVDQIRQARTATHLAIPLVADSVQTAARYGVLTTRPGILGIAEAKLNELLASVRQMFGDKEAERLATAMWVLRGIAAGLDVSVVRLPGAVLRIKEVEAKILRNLEHAPYEYWVKLIEILTERFVTEERQARTMLLGYLGQGITELEEQAKQLIDAMATPDQKLVDEWLGQLRQEAQRR